MFVYARYGFVTPVFGNVVTDERIYFDLEDDVYELNIKKVGVKGIKALRKNMIIPTLVSAIQSLTDKVESLTARLTALENMSSN